MLVTSDMAIQVTLRYDVSKLPHYLTEKGNNQRTARKSLNSSELKMILKLIWKPFEKFYNLFSFNVFSNICILFKLLR